MKTTNRSTQFFISLIAVSFFLSFTGPVSANNQEEDPTLSWYDNQTVTTGQKTNVFKTYQQVRELDHSDVTHHWYDSGVPMNIQIGDASNSNEPVIETKDHTSDPTEFWYDNGVPVSHR